MRDQYLVGFAVADIWPLAVIVLAFALCAMWEIVAPARARRAPDNGRIASNVALGLVAALVAAPLPIGTVAAALAAQDRGIGLLWIWQAPWPIAALVLLLARSLLSYSLHRCSHATPLLWRIHRVHHSDPHIDVSTGLRNHPIELLLVLVPAVVLTIALGPPVTVVIAVDTVLFVAALWQHADARIPATVERLLAPVIVTPAFHRQHHSVERSEHDSNYGDILVVWDRLLGTAKAPRDPDHGVGLMGETPRAHHLGWQLLRPFRR